MSFSAEYAKTDRSTCKGSKEKIPQGALRVGKTVSVPSVANGKEMSVWYIPEPLFEAFRQGRAGAKRIEDTGEIDHFKDLKAADKKRLQKLVDDENAFQVQPAAVRFGMALYTNSPTGMLDACAHHRLA